MPPRRFSRHTFTTASMIDTDGDGSDDALMLTEPEPYRFRQFPDNTIHTVKEGDSLFTLAAKYYRKAKRPAGLWWVIADFQPDPIHDPTIKLTKGTKLVIPSFRTVVEEIFAEKRRDE